MLAWVGATGAGLLGVAAFQLGRDPGNRSTSVVLIGIVGLLCSMTLGLLVPLMAGAAFALIGRGLRPGNRSAVAVISGIGILAVPFALGLLFYAASLNT